MDDHPQVLERTDPEGGDELLPGVVQGLVYTCSRNEADIDILKQDVPKLEFRRPGNFIDNGIPDRVSEGFESGSGIRVLALPLFP